MKKRALLIASIIVSVFVVIAISRHTKPVISEPERIIGVLGAAVQDLGYEFSALEKLNSPATYTDNNGNTIVFNSFYCTDSARIKNEEVIFYSDVFDPKTANSTQKKEIEGKEAILCEKDGRNYLVWYPNEHTILMLDYDPDSVTEPEIIKMAESCK